MAESYIWRVFAYALCTKGVSIHAMCFDEGKSTKLLELACDITKTAPLGKLGCETHNDLIHLASLSRGTANLASRITIHSSLVT